MTPEPTIAEIKSWLQRHERIVLVTLVLMVAGFLGHRVVNLLADHAQTRATVAEQTLAAQKVTDAQLAANTAVITAQYAAMVEQLTKQNAALANAVTMRQGALATQQGADAHLPLTGLAERIQALASTPAGSVSIAPTGLLLTQPGALAVTQTLEEVPVLQANLNDIKQINTNLNQELTKSNTVAAALGTQVAGLNLQIKDADTACKAEVANVKAQGRKSKIRWFKFGFITGFVSGLYVGHAIL